MSEYKYTKSEIEQACEFFAPCYKKLYDDENSNFFLPQWLDKAIINAWTLCKSDLGYEFKIRQAYEDLHTHAAFTQMDLEN